MKKLLRCPLLWIVGFLLLHFQGIAQSNSITGTVVAPDNSAMPGVTVALKGQARGTVTDSDGKFTIEAKPDEVLVFSFIGMETQEVTVGNSRTLSVTLKENIESLQEVVIVG